MKAYDKDSPQSGSRENWHTSASKVQTAVNNMVSSGSKYVRGTDCSSSACYAWRTVLNGNDRSSGILMSTAGRDGNKYTTAYTCEKIVKDGNDTSSNTSGGYGDYITRVGKYGQAASNLSDNTYTMVKRLRETESNYLYGGDVYSKVYARMQPGDFLVARTESYGHARLVEKVVVVEEDGVVSPTESYVIVTEQTSSLKNCTNTGLNESYKTTWLVGYGKEKYTFKYLAATTGQYYLPYRYNGTTTSSVLGFVATAKTDTSIDISWHAFDDLCDGYELEYAESVLFTDSKKIIFEEASECSETLENLKKDGKYYIRMRSFLYDDDGSIEFSGYNNWVSVDLETGKIDRENAPDQNVVSEKEYQDYVYRDISIDNETDYVK